MDDSTNHSKAAEVLSFVGDPIRLRILSTLYNTSSEPDPQPRAINYTDLQEAVNVEDSGRFNYHLKKLTGHFVKSVDGGYRLLDPGKEIVRLLRRGTLTDDFTLDPVPVDANCYRCGSQVTVSYNGDRVLTICESCAGSVALEALPYGTLTAISASPWAVKQREPNDLHRTVHESFERVSESMADDICPECRGSVSKTVRMCGSHELGANGVCPHCDRWSGLAVDLECRVCGRGSVCQPLFARMNHPALAEAMRRGGATTAWERLGWICNWSAEAVETPGEPPIRFTSPDEDIVIRVDADLGITAEEGLTED